MGDLIGLGDFKLAADGVDGEYTAIVFFSRL
jgi:hypothetical protein